MIAPDLPNVARSVLKSCVVALAAAGVITSADAEDLIRLLGLDDA